MVSKKDKIIYWIFTGLFSAMMVMSATMYFLKQGEIQATYLSFGYPAYLMYINASAKVLGTLAILQNKFKTMKQWAYAGFAYILFFGGLAHILADDGQWMGAAMGAVLLIGSIVYNKRVFK